MAASAAVARVVVTGAGSVVANGLYTRRDAASMPDAFARVCVKSGWDAAATWSQLNGPRAWWEAPNGSLFYFNSDGQWWLDSGETGLGLYVSRAAGVGGAPPTDGWMTLGDGALPLPSVKISDGALVAEALIN
jgi:hypothetical protein